MKKIIIYSILFLVLLSCTEKNNNHTKEIKNKSGLYLIKIGKQYGYIEKEGIIKINPQFDYASNFEDGLALVRIGDKWGYIDKEGKIKINPQFDYASNFEDGLALVRVGDKYGYIDKEGKIKINPQFDDANNFEEGLARVRVGDKWGYIDKEGKIKINLQFDDANNFSEGLAVIVKDGKYGFVNKKGDIIINPQFDEAKNFSNGLAVVSLNDKYGYIDVKGQIIIDLQYDNANSFINEMALVKLNNKYGYIDKKGKIVINPQFDDAQNFEDGLAVVRTGNKYGYINKEDKIIINPQFDYADNFQGDLALVKIGNKYGYIDKNGKIIINPQFDYADSFSDDIALISIGDKYGFIDKGGKIVVNPQFNYANAIFDTKEIAKNLCNCRKLIENRKVRAYMTFIDSFPIKKYIKRIEAKNELSSLSSLIYNKKEQCESKILDKFSALKSKFINDDNGLQEFNLGLSKNMNSCFSNNKSSILYDQIEQLITTIIDPEPDINKIKEDLIGHKVLGWNFDYLSEFKKAKILNTTKGDERIEYKVFFNLYDETSKSSHDCEAIIIYQRNSDGWYFNNINLNYITYTNTFYPDKWTKITPLQNCKWNAENKYKMGWKTYNSSYASVTKTGPSLGGKTLPSSKSYYIKSLENKVIKVKFTYRPN